MRCAHEPRSRSDNHIDVLLPDNRTPFFLRLRRALTNACSILDKRIAVHRRIVRSEKPKAPPRKRERIAPPSLPLDYPPSVADMLAGLGLTHDIIAARVGISRQQVTRRPKLKANRL